MLEGGSSQPPEMAALIQGLTDQIVNCVMDHLNLASPLPGGRATRAVVICLGRNLDAHLLVMTNNEPFPGSQSHHEAPVPEISAPAYATDVVALMQSQIEALTERVTGQMRRGTNTELAGLAPFLPEIKSATMPVGMKLPFFTKFTGKTDPEEYIAKFQSQISFQHPCSKVYCRVDPRQLEEGSSMLPSLHKEYQNQEWRPHGKSQSSNGIGTSVPLQIPEESPKKGQPHEDVQSGAF
ncbi:hypothetical protein LIER_03014 [Lithospermum erythrorhizon]|uniref:Uncharacterized protein n=1 Tax=Lithospermum erythrorhizon TaxID=34254 RepID=A0AAV3NRL7_LITER